MATTITGNGNYLEITEDGVVTVTVPKGMTVMRVDGDYLEIDHDGKYRWRALYSDVTTPSTASAEALRVAVKNILNA